MMGSGGRRVWPDADRFDWTFLDDRVPRSLPMVLSSAGSACCGLKADDFTKVAWLEVLDFEDSLDRSSVREVGLELPDMRECGLSSSLSRTELATPFLFSSRLVSGGLGGRSDLRVEDLLVDPKSADLDRFNSSTPMSVASGVGGSVPVRRADAEVVETSSLLTASLLCALLKLG